MSKRILILALLLVAFWCWQLQFNRRRRVKAAR